MVGRIRSGRGGVAEVDYRELGMSEILDVVRRQLLVLRHRQPISPANLSSSRMAKVLCTQP